MEYFIPLNIYSSNTPLLSIDEENYRFEIKKPLPYQEKIKVEYSGEQPIETPFLGGIHYMPRLLVRNDIRQSIEQYLINNAMELGKSNLQFIDVEFVGMPTPGEFSYMHIMSTIKCVDKQNSKYVTAEDEDDEDYDPDEFIVIRKLAIDYNKLKKTPINERMIFRLGELEKAVLFEKGLTNFILSKNPESVKFVPADEWTSSLFIELD